MGNSMPRLRVMTYNIHGERADLAPLLCLLRQYALDVLLLQEVLYPPNAQWLSERLQLPYWHFALPTGWPKGIALLSRWPLGPAHTLSLRTSTQGKVALAAQVHHAAASLWLCPTHLDPPRQEERGTTLRQLAGYVGRELFRTTRRYLAVRELRAWLRQLADATWIIGGDFNTFPLSRADRYLSHDFVDALRKRPWRYWHGTERQPGWPFAPRIDFLYHSPALTVVDAHVIRSTVSDHFPILAVFTPSRELRSCRH